MSTRPAGERGPLAAALAAIGASLAELAATRAALFTLELRDEARRAANVVALGAAATAFLQLALLMLAALVVLLAWDTHRVLAAGAMTLLYGACAAGLFRRMRARAVEIADAFPATREEFRRDFANVRGRS